MNLCLEVGAGQVSALAGYEEGKSFSSTGYV